MSVKSSYSLLFYYFYYQYPNFDILENIHLIKVISERFQYHFSEYALMILKRFFALISAFTWTKVLWCFGKVFLYLFVFFG